MFVCRLLHVCDDARNVKSRPIGPCHDSSMYMHMYICMYRSCTCTCTFTVLICIVISCCYLKYGAKRFIAKCLSFCSVRSFRCLQNALVYIQSMKLAIVDITVACFTQTRKMYYMQIHVNVYISALYVFLWLLTVLGCVDRPVSIEVPATGFVEYSLNCTAVASGDWCRVHPVAGIGGMCCQSCREFIDASLRA